MRFGFPVWYSCGLEKAVKKAHNLGFDYIEFDLNSPWPEKLKKRELEILENLRDEYGLEIAFHGPLFGVDISHPNGRISDASLLVILEALEFSERFNPFYFNFHVESFSNPHNLGLREIRNGIYRKTFENIKKIADSTKIPLVLENNGNNPLFRTLEEMRKLKSCDLDFCFDVGHAAKSKFSLEKAGAKVRWNIKGWIESLKNRILAAHLHDCLLADGAKDHVPIGSGNINFSEVFDALKKTKCKYALIEVSVSLTGKLTDEQIKNSLELCRSNLK